jgi:ABC-2 type transport system ATP-binding protein
MTKNLPILKINNLNIERNKQFKLRIKKLNLYKGSFVCIVGANGSGKTTTIEAITGLIETPANTININGYNFKNNPIATKKYLGYIPDDDNWIIPELSAKEYFLLLESIYKKAGVKHNINKQIKFLANKLIFKAFNQPMSTLSHGNRKKVQIIAALLHKPKLLVVDELRNGLDPIVIKQAEDLLLNISQQGTTILAATHDLWWAQRVASSVNVLKDGKIILSDNLANIVNQWGSLETAFMEHYH